MRRNHNRRVLLHRCDSRAQFVQGNQRKAQYALRVERLPAPGRVIRLHTRQFSVFFVCVFKPPLLLNWWYFDVRYSQLINISGAHHCRLRTSRWQGAYEQLTVGMVLRATLHSDKLTINLLCVVICYELKYANAIGPSRATCSWPAAAHDPGNIINMKPTF